jgi:hypothetical protein
VKALLTLIASSLAALAFAVPGSAAEYVSGVTDFPSASSSERYVPFVTDFPKPLQSAVSEAHANGGLDGLDAAVAALGLALGALAAASLPAVRRRGSVSSA